ncbi:MAG: hypothetical protein ACI9FR_002041 [Cryomorphaceae bacterium]|jgi:hypothetical protein
MKIFLKFSIILLAALVVSACGNGKKNFSMKVHSDPLGAYLLMQVNHKGDENPEWIFLGPTPVILEKVVDYRNATTVSLKVIRPGFFEQVKTWKAKDFAKEHKKYKKISWVPNMVKQ